MLGKKIHIRACVFTFSLKLEKSSFHVADLPRTRTNCTEIIKAREGRAKALFLWRCRCRRFVDLKLPNKPKGTPMQSSLNLVKRLYWICMVNLYHCAEGIDKYSNQLGPFNFGGSNQWQKKREFLTFKSVLALELSAVLSDLTHSS